MTNTPTVGRFGCCARPMIGKRLTLAAAIAKKARRLTLTATTSRHRIAHRQHCLGNDIGERGYLHPTPRKTAIGALPIAPRSAGGSVLRGYSGLSPEGPDRSLCPIADQQRPAAYDPPQTLACVGNRGRVLP